MFNKKLKERDLKKLQELTKILSHHILICQAVELKKRVLLREFIKKYKLKEEESWIFDVETGKIEKSKEEE